MLDKKIVVIGMGYIGFPTALLFSDAGFQVIGVEKNTEKIRNILSRKIYQGEPGLYELYNKVKDRFKLTDKIERGDTYIICVQTAIDENKKVILSHIYKAVEEIGNILERGNLVIIESTVPVSETKKIARKISEISKIDEENLLLAYCPEKSIPSKLLKEMTENNKIIGGFNKRSTDLAASFYSKIIKGKVVKTKAENAELSKLIENVYRDVNIAFANELSIICDKLDLNVFDIIKLANMHPRVNVHKPSCGVGGSCIPVDAYLISNSIGEKDCELMMTVRKINDYKPKYVAKKILNHTKGSGTVGILGVTYKPDTDDIRLTPAKVVIEELLNKDCKVFVYDPYTSETFGAEKASIEKVLKADVIAILTPHKEFEKIKNLLNGKKVVDPTGLTTESLVCL